MCMLLVQERAFWMGMEVMQTQTLSLTMNSVFANANTKIAYENTFANTS